MRYFELQIRSVCSRTNQKGSWRPSAVTPHCPEHQLAQLEQHLLLLHALYKNPESSRCSENEDQYEYRIVEVNL